MSETNWRDELKTLEAGDTVIVVMPRGSLMRTEYGAFQIEESDEHSLWVEGNEYDRATGKAREGRFLLSEATPERLQEIKDCAEYARLKARIREALYLESPSLAKMRAIVALLDAQEGKDEHQNQI